MIDLREDMIGRGAVVTYRSRSMSFQGTQIPVYGFTRFLVPENTFVRARFSGRIVAFDSQFIILEPDLVPGRRIAILRAAIEEVECA